MPGFTEFLEKQDLVHELLNLADPYLVYRLRLVSRPVQNVVDKYLARTFNIDTFLQRRFFANAVAFRSMMAETGCLISGVTALEFFARAQWEETPLELFVHHCNVVKLCRNLVDVFGYSFVPDNSTPMASLDEALHDSTWQPRSGEPLWLCSVVAVFEFRRRYRDKWRQVLVWSPHCKSRSALEAVFLSYPNSKPNPRGSCMFFYLFRSLFSQRR